MQKKPQLQDVKELVYNPKAEILFYSQKPMSYDAKNFNIFRIIFTSSKVNKGLIDNGKCQFHFITSRRILCGRTQFHVKYFGS